MPYASEPTKPGLIRGLAYGKGKSKKTWWALRAAEMGYNVILLDGDDGSDIQRQLPLEARKRILIVDVVDTQKRAVFAVFMALFCRNASKFVWDENTKQITMGLRDTSHTFIEFEPSKLTANDVVIIDSWTALSDSTQLQFALEQQIDMSDADKVDWDGFGYQGRFLDFVLGSIHSMPCHVIVIGHSYTYEKYRGQGKDRVLISSTVQPMSASGPHGGKLSRHFSDILFFEKLSESKFTISTGGGKDMVSGSRVMAPAVYDWQAFGPEKLFEAVDAKPTSEACVGAVLIPAGTEQVLPSKQTSAPLAFNKKPTISSIAAEPAPLQVQASPAKPEPIKTVSLADRIRLSKGGVK